MGESSFLPDRPSPGGARSPRYNPEELMGLRFHIVFANAQSSSGKVACNRDLRPLQSVVSVRFTLAEERDSQAVPGSAPRRGGGGGARAGRPGGGVSLLRPAFRIGRPTFG